MNRNESFNITLAVQSRDTRSLEMTTSLVRTAPSWKLDLQRCWTETRNFEDHEIFSPFQTKAPIFPSKLYKLSRNDTNDNFYILRLVPNDFLRRLYFVRYTWYFGLHSCTKVFGNFFILVKTKVRFVILMQ